ncbi:MULTISPECIES: antitoxin Xre/MbcA/ParS toxin-binding domain-containing protein [unclassified Sphingomonas]|uniref:antitoxin Xre/MbcA/ParS toxin-binding domain-containing protein n=1 Tax=unclassified Sphingomonas TaxID=196159 RepID=UPI00226B8A8F|nr:MULTISPECIES: antitoxin Xre/MbcA/ParS toxin-binding domain-containing protein [unclassified Sphingomonas]
MSTVAALSQGSDASRVLSDAIGRIAEFWQLSNSRLGMILGLSGPTISRLRSGTYRLEAGSKAFELGQHLLRLFRSLDSWLGQDDASARSWLTTPNHDLGATPLDLIGMVRGLLRTSDYVDALRARV